jgi:hypothetical protein
MKKLCILIILLSIATISYSNSQSLPIVDSLKRQGIDTIGVFTTFCVGGYGSDEPGDTCFDLGVYNNIYIMWTRGSKKFILKQNNCYSYETIELNNCVMFDFFKLFETDLKGEKIFPQGYKIKVKNGDTISTSFAITDHGCSTIISLFAATDSLRIRINKNDFDKESNKEYYEHNINLKSYRWSLLIKEQISDLEKNKRFVRKN